MRKAKRIVMVLISILILTSCSSNKNNSLNDPELALKRLTVNNGLEKQIFDLSRKTYIDNGLYTGFSLGRLSEKVNFDSSVWLTLTERNLNKVSKKDEKTYKNLADYDKLVNQNDEEMLYNFLLLSELQKALGKQIEPRVLKYMDTIKQENGLFFDPNNKDSIYIQTYQALKILNNGNGFTNDKLIEKEILKKLSTATMTTTDFLDNSIIYVKILNVLKTSKESLQPDTLLSLQKIKKELEYSITNEKELYNYTNTLVVLDEISVITGEKINPSAFVNLHSKIVEILELSSGYYLLYELTRLSSKYEIKIDSELITKYLLNTQLVGGFWGGLEASRPNLKFTVSIIRLAGGQVYGDKEQLILTLNKFFDQAKANQDTTIKGLSNLSMAIFSLKPIQNTYYEEAIWTKLKSKKANLEDVYFTQRVSDYFNSESKKELKYDFNIEQPILNNSIDIFRSKYLNISNEMTGKIETTEVDSTLAKILLEDSSTTSELDLTILLRDIWEL